MYILGRSRRSFGRLVGQGCQHPGMDHVDFDFRVSDDGSGLLESK